MQELRASKGGALGVLFAFDPRRQPSCFWEATRLDNGELCRWAIPAADDLYDAYLEELRDEGLLEE